MDPHHVNHHTPTEAASGGGTSANNSQSSQGSNSATPVVIPGPSSSSSSSAPPPPVVVGATQPPLTSPVPAAKIVSRNVNGTRELQVSGTVDRCQWCLDTWTKWSLYGSHEASAGSQPHKRARPLRVYALIERLTYRFTEFHPNKVVQAFRGDIRCLGVVSVAPRDCYALKFVKQHHARHFC